MRKCEKNLMPPIKVILHGHNFRSKLRRRNYPYKMATATFRVVDGFDEDRVALLSARVFITHSQ